MKELIGLPFKRNVYGPSIWTDTVKDIRVKFPLTFSKDCVYSYSTPEIYIVGEKHSFPLKEVIFYYKELSKEQKDKFIKLFNLMKYKEEMIEKFKKDE